MQAYKNVIKNKHIILKEEQDINCVDSFLIFRISALKTAPVYLNVNVLNISHNRDGNDSGF